MPVRPTLKVKYVVKSHELDYIMYAISERHNTPQQAVDMKSWMDANLKPWTYSIHERNVLRELPVGDGELYSSSKIEYWLLFTDNADLELWKAQWSHLDSKPSFIKYLRPNQHVDTHMKKMLGPGWR